jgi:DnaJ-class molecular chaperone
MSNTGKGSKRRPYNQETWDRNWVLIFGVDCKFCHGTGYTLYLNPFEALEDLRSKKLICKYCDGLGRIERNKKCQ